MKSLSAICHYDDENLTYDGVVVPSIVPVLIDFDDTAPNGRARLTEIPADPEAGLNYAIRADITFDEEIFLPENDEATPPTVVAAVVQASREYDGSQGVAYLRGGYVSNVSVVTRDMEMAVVGS